MKRASPKVNESVDESAESEITILPDGRVFAFGITGPIAAVLATIPTADERTRRRLDRISRLGAGREQAHVGQALQPDVPTPSARKTDPLSQDCPTDLEETE